MKIRLFEFEDLPRFPNVIREGMTDYLRFLFNIANLYKPATSILANSFSQSKATHIIDLCSGSGGSVEKMQSALSAHLNVPVKFILTDKFPNITSYKFLEEKSGGHISFIDSPVNAANVPEDLKGFRTIFSGFHHFNETTAKAVITDAVDKREGIAIFDGGDKNIFMIMAIIIAHPIVFFFCTPFFRPFRLSRFFFTYLIPVIPLCTIWDGIVSVLRLYSPGQLLKMAEKSSGNNYKWQSGKIRNRFGLSITYLTGVPVENLRNN